MAKRRNRRPAARGRFRRERPTEHVITPDFQASLPFEQRRKYKVLIYSNGRFITKAINKPPVQTPIRSSMLRIMAMAVFKRSHLKSGEIASRRFRILNMNDNWRSWDDEHWARRKGIVRHRYHQIQQIRNLTGLPACTCAKQVSIS